LKEKKNNNFRTIFNLKNLKEQMNQLTGRTIASSEYTCPLCRQLANIVLPITPTTRLSRNPTEYYSNQLSGENTANSSRPVTPKSPDLPFDSKLTLQSGSEQQTAAAPIMNSSSLSNRKLSMTSEVYDRVMTMLKIRPYSDPESVSLI
jgi:hypothetical protein